MKFLIIRFSSIGDIVLTTPVIRCLKKQVPGAEVLEGQGRQPALPGAGGRLRRDDDHP